MCLPVHNGGHLIYSILVLLLKGVSYQSAADHLCFRGVTVSTQVAFSVSFIIFPASEKLLPFSSSYNQNVSASHQIGFAL
jgi:hypothetical protein